MSVEHLTVVICDDCGERTAPNPGMSAAARVAAISDGWTHPAFARDRCPACHRSAA